MTRNSIITIILLVVLRLAIGWQLLYEGMWKLDTLDSARPWSSAGYLRNAEGPFRSVFRSLAGDPDDLDWLNYEVVANRWDNWKERFKSNYGLSERQAKSLNRLLNGAHGDLNGRKVYASDKGKLLRLPNGIQNLRKASGIDPKIAWFDPEQQCLYVDGERHLKPNERDRLLKLVEFDEDDKFRDSDNEAFHNAVDVVFKRQKRGMGYKEKLAGAVRGNPDLVGHSDWQRVGQKAQYHTQLARYENLRGRAETNFHWDHLGSDWNRIQSLRTEITGPVKSLESELQDKAMKLLTRGQLNRGPESEPWSMLRFVDLSTIWGLTALGTLLMLGLFTRFAAVAAAGLLFSFYLAMPPLPGIPEMPGPEHSFIVNKNLIEVIALLAIAAVPTGRWFGVDTWLAASRKRSAAKKSAV